MSSLRSLVLNAVVDDIMMDKISRHFLHLQSLQLHRADLVTSVGYASLATLSDLRRLIIGFLFIGVNDSEMGIRRLAEAGRLEEVSLIGITKLTPTTFLSFVRSCANLHHLSMRTLKYVDSAANAVEVSRQMAGRKRNLDVAFFDTNKFTPWTAKEVTAELEEANRVNGCVIRVTPKQYTGRFRWYD